MTVACVTGCASEFDNGARDGKKAAHLEFYGGTDKAKLDAMKEPNGGDFQAAYEAKLRALASKSAPSLPDKSADYNAGYRTGWREGMRDALETALPVRRKK